MYVYIVDGLSGGYSNNIAYNSGTMAWVRIRESAKVLYSDSSPDGVTWTNQFSYAYRTVFTNVHPTVVTNTTATANLVGYIQNMNIVPSPLERVTIQQAVQRAALW